MTWHFTSTAQPAIDTARLRASVGRIRTLLAKRSVPLLLPLALVGLWQLAASGAWMSSQILPAPTAVGETLLDLARSGDLLTDMLVSGRRICEGAAIGVLAGLSFGFLLGTRRQAGAYLEPLFRAFAAVPSLGWLPILILIFGIEEPLKVIIIAKAVFVPVTISTAQAIRTMPSTYMEAARVLRLRRRATLLRVMLPATLPTVFTGLRLGLNHAFIALVVVEMLAATDGIGYLMTWGRTLFQMDIVIAGILVVAVCGFGLDFLLKTLDRRLHRWAA